MSIDIDWETLTTGPEGRALADSIKDFIHEKFQLVELPRFIRSVHVHSFDFGKECPVVELKDICDPLPEFYEKDGEIDDGDDVDAHQDRGDVDDLSPPLRHSKEQDSASGVLPANYSSTAPSSSVHDFRPPGLRLNLGFADHVATPPSLLRSSTPGIPGGTSNLSYFHLPLSAGLSGTHTPLAAVAGGTPFSAGWDHYGSSTLDHHPYPRQHAHPPYRDPSTRPSTASADTGNENSSNHQQLEDDGPSPTTSPSTTILPDPMDTQIVLHISYDGTVHLSITAEILLDYPMPSFVGIPLKLNITGLSFDGVAIIAYLRKRAHFCFLGPEDAQTLVGIDGEQGGAVTTTAAEGKGTGTEVRHGLGGDKRRVGGLLREIQVESEIGRKEGGKQVLKNVGKVEKFVLEQIRRIFEDEFVWPSFWTFLV